MQLYKDIAPYIAVAAVLYLLGAGIWTLIAGGVLSASATLRYFLSLRAE